MRLGRNLIPPTNLTYQTQRDFTKYIQEDTQSSAERLFFYQKLFEKDPKNLEAANLYLRELNREGKYLTVVRLFQRNELSFRGTSKEAAAVLQQYKYADDNINALENVMRAPSALTGSS